MDYASYEDFVKLELIVAEVIGVEEVENSSNLYKLSLKVGLEERVIVSGIRQQYSREQLLGKKIVLVSNLLPKKIKGIESKGMLLACDLDEKNIVIVEAQGAESGWKVK